jgi:putative oxidoreductase
MALLLASAGYPGPHVADGSFLGPSLQWSALSHVSLHSSSAIPKRGSRSCRACAAGCNNALGNISVTKFSSGSLTIRGGSAAPGSAFYQRGLMKQALRICRHVESAFSTLQSAMRSAVELYWGFPFAQTDWAKRRNPPRMARFFTSLNVASSVFDAHFVSGLELTVEILSLLGLLSRRGAFPSACNQFVACWTVDLAALTPVFPDPGKFSVADPYTFLNAALMVFISGAGLFSVDTHISKKVRTAR